MKTANKLLLISDILLFLLIVIFFYFAQSRVNQIKAIKSSENVEVLGITDNIHNNKDFVLSVCIEEKCTYISEEDVGEDIHDLNIYVVEYVIPFINEIAGGKTVTTNRGGSFTHWKEDFVPVTTGLTDKIYNAFVSREDRVDIETVKGPYTDGKYAKQYIEVDNSTQTLFAWKDGEVIKKIDLSAAKDNYVVRGVFPIIDKGINPQAPSGRYMPYWMAFYYSPSQDSWYGLHGLVWWYENDIAKFEPESNIGIRRSNGCVRMIKEDAKFLYDIYEKGDPILIHE